MAPGRLNLRAGGAERDDLTDRHGLAYPDDPDASGGPGDSGDLEAGLALAAELGSIDWDAPWFRAYRVLGEAWRGVLSSGAGAWRTHMSRQAAQQSLRTMRAPATAPAQSPQVAGVAGADPAEPNGGHALHFVAQHALPAQTAYETHIFATGAVPTRANLHDCFNAAQWFAFPALKAAMNAAQAAEIAVHGVQSRRGGPRDAWTLFDENGALFACSDPGLSAALRSFDWHTLLVAQRAAWGRACEIHLVGHALLEKLAAPYKAMTAHVAVVDVMPAYFGWSESRRRAYLDAQLARRVSTWRSARDFAPLPVLGVPGWSAANIDPLFYSDTAVFRPGRRSGVGAGDAHVTLASQSGPGSRRLRKKGEESPDSNGQGDG